MWVWLLTQKIWVKPKTPTQKPIFFGFIPKTQNNLSLGKSPNFFGLGFWVGVLGKLGFWVFRVFLGIRVKNYIKAQKIGHHTIFKKYIDLK